MKTIKNNKLYISISLFFFAFIFLTCNTSKVQKLFSSKDNQLKVVMERDTKVLNEEMQSFAVGVKDPLAKWVPQLRALSDLKKVQITVIGKKNKEKLKFCGDSIHPTIYLTFDGEYFGAYVEREKVVYDFKNFGDASLYYSCVKGLNSKIDYSKIIIEGEVLQKSIKKKVEGFMEKPEKLSF